eukprot:scaffold526_cov356-Prasinococcus_capsulatus_cf.AAC.1
MIRPLRPTQAAVRTRSASWSRQPRGVRSARARRMMMMPRRASRDDEADAGRPGTRDGRPASSAASVLDAEAAADVAARGRREYTSAGARCHAPALRCESQRADGDAGDGLALSGLGALGRMAWGQPAAQNELLIERVRASDPALTALHLLPFRRLSDEELTQLMAAVKTNTALQELGVVKPLPPSALEALADALAANQRLRTLSAGNNTLADEGVAILCRQGLQHNEVSAT